jgi:hypothetical protein
LELQKAGLIQGQAVRHCSQTVWEKTVERNSWKEGEEVVCLLHRFWGLLEVVHRFWELQGEVSQRNPGAMEVEEQVQLQMVWVEVAY